MAVLEPPIAPARPEAPLRPRPMAAVVADELSTHRLVSLLAALALLWPQFRAWNEIVTMPGAGLAAVALTGGTLLLALLIGRAPTAAELRRLDRWLLAAGLLTLVTYAAAQLAAMTGYPTDEAAFAQSATNLMLHGHDPYGADLTGSLYAYAVPTRFWTYTMGGGLVTAFGYPSLPLLLTAPLIWLTGNGQAVPWAGVLALAAAVVLCFRLLPARCRGLALVAGVALPALPGLALSGVNAVLMLPLLLVLAARWPSIGRSGRIDRADLGAAVALGLALATNQLAWLLAPFLLVAIARSRGGRPGTRLAARFGGVGLLSFAALNLPFALWNPAAFLDGVAAPLTQHALPYGQGLVGLAAFLHTGGGHVELYGYAGAALYLALLGIYALRFRELGFAWPLLPVLALFVSDRSLAEYWLVLVPVMLVAVGAPRPEIVPARGRRWVPPAVGLGFAAAGGLLAAAVLSPAPLRLQVLSGRSDPQSYSVASLRVRVENRSGAALVPHFSTDASGQASPFWRILQGPRRLAPHAGATYLLAVPQAAVGPRNGSAFLLQAVSDSPRSVSTSAAFTQPGPDGQAN